jgi:hypothetical protein
MGVAYGTASVYCYYNTLGPHNQIFTYLGEEQDALLTAFKKAFLTTTTGNPLFSEHQLQNMTMLMPKEDPTNLGSLHRLENKWNQSNSDGGTTVIDPRPSSQWITQTAVDLQMGTNANANKNRNEEGKEAENNYTTHPVPQNLENIIYKVKDVIFHLVPPLFLKLSHTIDVSQKCRQAKRQQRIQRRGGAGTKLIWKESLTKGMGAQQIKKIQRKHHHLHLPTWGNLSTYNHQSKKE